MIADFGFSEQCDCRLAKCKYCNPDKYPHKELQTLRTANEALSKQVAALTDDKERLYNAALAAYSELQNGRPNGAKTMLRVGIKGGNVANPLDCERLDTPLI